MSFLPDGGKVLPAAASFLFPDPGESGIIACISLQKDGKKECVYRTES